MRSSRNLELPLLDIALELIKTRAFAVRLPGRDATIEDFVHFLEGLALRLWGSEEHLHGELAFSSELTISVDLRGRTQRR